MVLMGEAISNIHDGDINLGGEGSERNILKGIKRQCDIGQLSLFEHYNNIRVCLHEESMQSIVRLNKY